MKRIALILPAALFLVASCTGEVTEENILNDLVDEVQEEMNSNEDEESENSASFDVPDGSQAWDKFVADYDKGYDMIDGNKTFDGEEVKLTGLIEKVVRYTDSDGNEFGQACFGVTDDMMGKCQLLALFDPMQTMVLETAQEGETAITFTGKVKKKKFGEITIESCEMIFE